MGGADYRKRIAMSRFTGQQFKGAAKAARDERRREAESRNAASDARVVVDCGHVHGRGLGCKR